LALQTAREPITTTVVLGRVAVIHDYRYLRHIQSVLLSIGVRGMNAPHYEKWGLLYLFAGSSQVPGHAKYRW